MESTLGNSIFTTVARANGTAALYISSKGKTKTSRDQAESITAIQKYLVFSTDFESKMKPVTEFPEPTRNHVRFYIVRENSVLTSEYLEKELIFIEHPLCQLFLKGHSLIEHLVDIEKP